MHGFVKNLRGGREVNIINTLSKNNLSKLGEEGGGSTSIWTMSTNILFFFIDVTPKRNKCNNEAEVDSETQEQGVKLKLQNTIVE